MWVEVIVKICGMVFDIVVLGGTAWLIGWHGWSAWWMVLAIVACSGSWVLQKMDK